MALLNKFFFPSSTSTTSSAAVVTQSTNIQTNTFPPSLVSILSTSEGTVIPSSTLFSTSPSQHNNENCGGFNKKSTYNQTAHSKNYLSQFPFDGSQVRILVYRECDSQGRRLLFDSNALEKVYLKDTNDKINTKHNVKTAAVHGEANANTNNNRKRTLNFNKILKASNKGQSNGNFIEVCDEYGYKHNRPNSLEISNFGEMVFGALAMSFRGTSLKVHWLDAPSRLMCSQVFLTPFRQMNGQHSPSSTLSTKSVATPRTATCSEHDSVDGLSINSFSLPFSVGIFHQISLTQNDLSSSVVSSPLDVPALDQQSLLTNSESTTDSEPRLSSTYSTGNDSGYSALSRDQWSSSCQYSTRSSLSSVISEQSECIRKLSVGSESLGSGIPLKFSSDGSLRRRISRNMITSFENENSMNDLIGFVTDNYSSVATTNSCGSEGVNFGINNNPRCNYPASESRSNPEIGKKRENTINMKLYSRRAKLGLAVCITMSESFEEEMELFCSEHIALIESMLSRLRANTEKAYIHHNQFLQIMFQIWQDTQQWFLDLFTAPRIKCPIWLNITTSGSKYSKNVAECFIKELCWLLSFADTKDTNFFISTIITAILTHHLGWVSTVSPFNSSSSSAAIEQRAKLLKVSQKHPYNALWAQMSDLFGAIGQPSKLARTIIYGTEKLSIERLLNVLTYFIRCGEVRRSAKKEDFSKERLNEFVAQNKNEYSRKLTLNDKKVDLNQNRSEGILTRTPSCQQNLNSLAENDEMNQNVKIIERNGEKQVEYEYDKPITDKAIRTYKMNEIPTVLAFRDSRFVQQELRIGNYLMDTGIEKNSVNHYKKSVHRDSSSIKQKGQIRLTLTTPDNIELNVDDTNLNEGEDGAMEAIEIESFSKDPTLLSNLKQDQVENLLKKKPFFWSTIKEGLRLSDLNKAQCSIKKNQDQQQQQWQRQQKQQLKSPHLSLSDLITQNSMGKSDRMTWGIEPVKENVSLEEQIHFELSQKNIERSRGIHMSKEKSAGVVFVLGENEPLVNIKKSTEDLATDVRESLTSNDLKSLTQENNQLLCPLHQRMHNSATSSHQLKKHSGVKFNFEQFPQIVTNYMKSKNLLMTNYDLLMDKCSKLDIHSVDVSTHLDNSSSVLATEATKTKNTFPQVSTAMADITTSCMVCNGPLNAYQTPSNATELEFETDEEHNFTNTYTTAPTSTPLLPTVSSQTSVQTLISSTSNGGQADSDSCGCIQKEYSNIVTTSPKSCRKKELSANQKAILSQSGSTSSKTDKCSVVNEAMNLLRLPLPSIKELTQGEPQDDMKLPVGFVPSLFLNVNDHYIPDMVLQGTFASPKKWEMNLREDLALAAHSASLVSIPIENVAIVADMENWDVKLLSSQHQHFPYAGGQSTLVGMSQLVSTMLEIVQTMNSSGISAYECLSFMESKLQEIYLHSETLAAFLLETDFCSLSAVTTALNLSENDVPLLLSIASIHTPQISKKCGISFR